MWTSPVSRTFDDRSLCVCVLTGCDWSDRPQRWQMAANCASGGAPFFFSSGWKWRKSASSHVLWGQFASWLQCFSSQWSMIDAVSCQNLHRFSIAANSALVAAVEMKPIPAAWEHHGRVTVWTSRWCVTQTDKQPSTLSPTNNLHLPLAAQHLENRRRAWLALWAAVCCLFSKTQWISRTWNALPQIQNKVEETFFLPCFF